MHFIYVYIINTISWRSIAYITPQIPWRGWQRKRKRKNVAPRYLCPLHQPLSPDTLGLGRAHLACCAGNYTTIGFWPQVVFLTSNIWRLLLCGIYRFLENKEAVFSMVRFKTPSKVIGLSFFVHVWLLLLCGICNLLETTERLLLVLSAC